MKGNGTRWMARALPRMGALLLLFAPVPASSQSVPESGREVMERYEAQEDTRDTEMKVRMTLVDRRGRRRERAVSMLTRTRDDGTRMQLLRFLEPADVAGTGFLSIENRDRADDAWLYLPALRRTRRIAGADKRDSFVGTDFTFEDLDREVLEDYRYTLLREERLNGVPTWVVEAVPVGPGRIAETAYGKRELWIAQAHAVLLQGTMYDSSGTLVRRLVSTDVRQVPGTKKWRPYRLVMEDVREGSRTELSVEEIRIDQGLDEDLFTERYLARNR